MRTTKEENKHLRREISKYQEEVTALHRREQDRLAAVGGRAHQTPAELVVEARGLMREGGEEVRRLLELLQEYMSKAAGDGLASDLLQQRAKATRDRLVPHGDDEPRGRSVNATTETLLRLVKEAEAQQLDAQEAHTLLRAVLADAAVGQRLVEDHMIVTATMVQLKARNGSLETQCRSLEQELQAVQAAAEREELTYRDLLTAAQQAHGTLRDRVIELQGELNAVSRGGAIASPMVGGGGGGFSPAEAEYQHEYRNPLATDDQRILPYSSGASAGTSPQPVQA